MRPRIKIVFSAAAGAVVLACAGAATVSTGFNELNAPYDARVMSDYKGALACV